MIRVFLFTVLFLGADLVGAKGSKPPAKSVQSFLPCPENIFWLAVLMSESTGDPFKKTLERSGEYSLGWYQLSVSDSTRYPNCPKTEQELYDPIKNTLCKNSIASALRLRHPNETYQRALGRYWAVLRGPEWGDEMRVTAWNNFVEHARQLGCTVLR